MDEKRKQDIDRIQEMALDHAIEEMEASDACGLDSKEDRGNRGFLTGMASKSLSVAVKLEQFKILMARPNINPEDDEESEHRAADALIKSARAEVRQIMERAGAGAKPRG
jgi:hypothetical protein